MSENPLLVRLSDGPTLLAARHISAVEASLRMLIGHPRSSELIATHAAADDGYWYPADDWRSTFRPYVVRDGILLIPVKGVLLAEFPWAFGSWATGYAYLMRAVDRGIDDPNVRGIGLICNSWGGYVAECFDVVDRIHAVRSLKPIRAFVHEAAYSACYAIASAATKVVVARTGGVGSIGVLRTHVDVSRAMEQFGLKVTLIYKGKHKVDGNPNVPVTDEMKARWEEQMEETYGLFCDTVARNRGMTADAVRATEAECFTAAEAVGNGLADQIGPFDDAVAAFATDPQAADETEGEDEMTTASAAPAAITQAQVDTARSEGQAAGRTEGLAEGRKEGAQAEQGRISAILGSEEAKGRTKQAQHIAFKTSMSADEAKAMLAQSGTEAAAPADPLAAAMAGIRNPAVGADTGGSQKTEDAEAAAMAGNIVSLYTGKPNQAA